MIPRSFFLRFFGNIAALAFCLGLAGIGSARGQALFQPFTYTGSGNELVGAFGWSAFEGGSATDISTVANGGMNDYAAVSNAIGNPNNPKGYIFVASQMSVNQDYALVGTLAGGLSIADDAQISWTMGNSLAASTVRLVIQVGGNGTVGSGTWYASSQAFSNATPYASADFTGASTASVTFGLNFSTAAADWLTLGLDPGNSMTLGSTPGADLASSTITGIGFFLFDSNKSVIRLDSLTVAPEPPAVALLLLGLLGAGGLTFQARRKHAAQA